MDAFTLEKFLTRLAVDGLAFTVNQSKSIEALYLNTLVQNITPLLSLDWAGDLGAFAIDKSVTFLASNSNAVSIFKLKVLLATDSDTLSVGTLDESSVALLDTSGGLSVDLLHDVAWWASLVGALTAVPSETLAFLATRHAAGTDNVGVGGALDLLALAIGLLVAGWALELEALAVDE